MFGFQQEVESTGVIQQVYKTKLNYKVVMLRITNKYHIQSKSIMKFKYNIPIKLDSYNHAQNVGLYSFL